MCALIKYQQNNRPVFENHECGLLTSKLYEDIFLDLPLLQIRKNDTALFRQLRTHGAACFCGNTSHMKLS